MCVSPVSGVYMYMYVYTHVHVCVNFKTIQFESSVLILEDKRSE